MNRIRLPGQYLDKEAQIFRRIVDQQNPLEHSARFALIATHFCLRIARRGIDGKRHAAMVLGSAGSA
jgi:hypothetical protein